MQEISGSLQADIAWTMPIGRPHLDYPFAGARMLRDLHREMQHVGIGRRRLRRLMRLMEIEEIFCQHNTSEAAPRASGESISASAIYHRPSQSGPGDGYHVSADSPGFCISWQ